MCSPIEFCYGQTIISVCHIQLKMEPFLKWYMNINKYILLKNLAQLHDLKYINLKRYVILSLNWFIWFGSYFLILVIYWLCFNRVTLPKLVWAEHTKAVKLHLWFNIIVYLLPINQNFIRKQFLKFPKITVLNNNSWY